MIDAKICAGHIFDLSVATLLKVCKYNKLRHQRFAGPDQVGELCPFLHNIAYPYALAALYDGRLPARQLSCPINPRITVRLSKAGKWGVSRKTAYWLVLNVTRLLGFPWDKELFKVSYVVEGHPSCPRHQRSGTIPFNEDDRAKICPAAMYTIFPGAVAGVKVLQCVDHEGIIFEAKSRPETVNGASAGDGLQR